MKLASVSAVPVDVILTTADAGLLPVPVRLTIPAGQLTLQQLVSVGSSSVKKSVALTAATQAVSKPLTINVTP
jgi:PDZ domain-containing secreted protein